MEKIWSCLMQEKMREIFMVGEKSPGVKKQ